MSQSNPISFSSSTNLVGEGIEALKRGDKALGLHLLGQALINNPHNELAWLWLSGAVDTDAERKFCLEHALALNPNLVAAVKGLALLPSNIKPLSPLLKMVHETKSITPPRAQEFAPKIVQPPRSKIGTVQSLPSVAKDPALLVPRQLVPPMEPSAQSNQRPQAILNTALIVALLLVVLCLVLLAYMILRRFS